MPRPTTASTSSVILSVRLDTSSAVEELFDRFVERSGIGQRGVFELFHLPAGLADQERRRAIEAGGVRRLGVRGDLVVERRAVAVAGPFRQVQPRHLLREAL